MPVLPLSLHNAFSGSYKSIEDWDILCQQDHLSPQSPQGQMTERKVSTVHKIQLNHTWVGCKIAIVINGKDSIFRAIQHLTYPTARSKFDIKAVFLSHKARYLLNLVLLFWVFKYMMRTVFLGAQMGFPWSIIVSPARCHL